MSDNTANDRLLNYVGGPTAVRDFIRRKGLGNIRFGPGERLLQSQTAGLDWKPEYAFGSAFTRARARLPESARIEAFERYVADPPDGAAPAAIAGALARAEERRITVGELDRLSDLDDGIVAYRQAAAARRGARRRWTFGHKTGTGQDLAGRTAGYNDVGLLMSPDGKAYAIAVMIGDTPKPISDRQQLMQAVVSAIVANHRS